MSQLGVQIEGNLVHLSRVNEQFSYNGAMKTEPKTMKMGFWLWNRFSSLLMKREPTNSGGEAKGIGQKYSEEFN